MHLFQKHFVSERERAEQSKVIRQQLTRTVSPRFHLRKVLLENVLCSLFKGQWHRTDNNSKPRLSIKQGIAFLDLEQGRTLGGSVKPSCLKIRHLFGKLTVGRLRRFPRGGGRTERRDRFPSLRFRKMQKARCRRDRGESSIVGVLLLREYS